MFYGESVSIGDYKHNVHYFINGRDTVNEHKYYNKLRFKESRLGYVKVDDGSIIILRVAIVDVRVREEASPLGLSLTLTLLGA